MEFFTDINPAEQRLYSMAARKGIPLHGVFELTPLCTLDCTMCYVRLSREELERRGKLLTTEQWLGLAEQLRAAGTLNLLLTGGEPMAYSGFRDLYLGLREMGFLLLVNTNATLINENWADFFAKNPPRRFNITLYGANTQDYAAVCGSAAGFDKALQGIRLLKERGLPIKLSGSMVKANLASLDEYLALCKELDIPVMTETYMIPASRERFHPFDRLQRLSPEEYARTRLRLQPTMYETESLDRQFRAELSRIEKNRGTTDDSSAFACRAGKSSFIINWQGKMRPCLLLHEPEVNVLEASFLQAWEKLRVLCSEVPKDPKCTVCAYRSLCPRCPAVEQAETGAFGSAGDYLCACTEAYAQEIKVWLAARDRMDPLSQPDG